MPAPLAAGAVRLRLEQPVLQQPRSAPHRYPLGQRQRVPRGVGQNAGHHALRPAGHALHLPGRGARHDEHPPAAGTVSGSGDPQHVQRADRARRLARERHAVHLGPRPRQRPHPHAVDGRGERRFHHRHALAAREREPHRHQCRGCPGRPGFHLLLLQKAHCPAQGAAGLPGWAVHAAVPRGRAAVRLHPRHRNGAPAGGLQLLRARSFLRLPGGIPRRGVPCLQLQRTVCPDHSPL